MHTAETNYLAKTHDVTSFISQRNPCSALTALRTRYRYDIKQTIYFVINSYQAIFDVIGMDIMKLVKQSQQLDELVPEQPPHGC